MRIPKRFKIANREWRVRFKKLSGMTLGETHYRRAEIWLDPRYVSEDELYHTFLHELLHATSNAMGWARVDDDENRIDALAGLLAQAFMTASD